MFRLHDDGVGAGLFQFFSAAETPQHPNARHAVGDGAFDIEVAVADHRGVMHGHLEVHQCIGLHRRFFAERA